MAIKVYIAGPMRGHKDLNYPAFDEAAAYLRKLGYEVRSPAENDRAHGLMGEEAENYASLLPELFRWDLESVLWADAVALLSGWEKSKGTALEISVAAVLKTPCVSIDAPFWEHDYVTD